MQLYALLAISLLSVVPTCSRNKDIQCTNTGARVNITGFDSTELRRITTYKYPQNGLFAMVLDSEKVEVRYGFQKTDTLDPSGDLQPGFDYEITTAPTVKTWRISNLSFYQTIREDNGTGSFRCGVAAYQMNDSLFSYPESDNGQNRIFLHR
jgi:hypothetical protein